MTRGHDSGGQGTEPHGVTDPDRRPVTDAGRFTRRGQGSEAALGLDTLVRLQRRRPVPDTPRRLTLPDGMTASLGWDAVAVPDRLGPLVVPRLPRLGCVYTDGARWWWIVPSDSDYALPWPSPAHYAPGALVNDTARLIHRPDGAVPYTPPIPLYLALCRVLGTAPDWSRAVSA
ncbi:hypothetical protein GCM10010339_00890 [Streptomyces alanosinicus]|uniref:Uncharacterized protein n=1 Tax=Streptomyces alanosinicus TaxID=68171 RepID=A0A919CZ57_9ACTN|nr:hypothetical protein GCM10010339_00890 [Streptomyces alanosinicus]